MAERSAGGAVTHAHAIARAPGAIDAVCLICKLEDDEGSMLPHAGSWTLNEFIPIAGQAAADNIAPAWGNPVRDARADPADVSGGF